MSTVQNSISGEFDLKQEKIPLVAVGVDHTIVPATEVSRVLLRVKGTFPFDLYPDELIIEEKRLIVKKNMFPFFSTTVTLPISRLTLFEWNKSILYSSVFIRGAYTDNIELTVSWLPHNEAKKAKEIVDGLSLKLNESVDVVESDKNRLAKTMQVLGQAY